MEYYTKEQFDFVLTQCPTSFGETYLNVYLDDKANAVESATKKVMKYGKSCDMDFINYNEENWNLYYKALNTALLFREYFEMATVMIALVILKNVQMSAFDQERGRLGVLQALGVTNREIALRYLGKGIKTGVISSSARTSLSGSSESFLLQGALVGCWDIPGGFMCWYVWDILYWWRQWGAEARWELKKYTPNENINV